MAAVPGMAQRDKGHGVRVDVPLQTKVPAKVKERYKRAAARRKISLSMYLEYLIELDPLAADTTDQEDASRLSA